MTAFPGIVLGVIFSFVLIAINYALVRFSQGGKRISPKNFLRASIVATLALAVLPLIFDEGLKDGAWAIFFFIGFQTIALVTSFFLPDERDSPSA